MASGGHTQLADRQNHSQRSQVVRQSIEVRSVTNVTQVLVRTYQSRDRMLLRVL